MLSASSASAIVPSFSYPFNPRDYVPYQHIARCTGINRSMPDQPSVQEIQLQYTYIFNPRATRTLLLVHGWPSLWSTWSNQILHFGPSYSLLVPTLRGFGPSTHPGDVQTSGAIPDIVEDLACIMRDAQVEQVTCIGHDWGAQVCWEAARARPDLVQAVAGAVVPYMPSAGNFTPIESIIPFLPHLTYQVYFASRTKTAVTELNASIRRSLRAALRTVDSPPPPAFLTSRDDFLGAWRNVTQIPQTPLFTLEEEDYLVEQYKIQGFEYTLEFYTNANRISAYERAQSQGNFTIPQPALFIAPTGDPVADWLTAAKLLGSSSYIPKLTTETMSTAHWPQLERPKEFNQILERWLNELSPSSRTPGGSSLHTGSARDVGEL
ncbi:Alpha/Beta hydrolase protein [Gautieria morchelliformis]|nr:Alpha/Beta hydrolase protein [Gautieria morchelliformis]